MPYMTSSVMPIQIHFQNAHMWLVVRMVKGEASTSIYADWVNGK